jgi:hypothetical protein
MTPSEKLALLNPIRYALAALIVMGGAMHLIGLIMALLHSQRLGWVCWFFYFFAILVYPISSGMILKNTQRGYWIAAVAPCVGGLFIFLGFFWPDTGFLKLLAGTVEKEITWVGFVQVTSESMAVAYAVFLIYHKVWQLH